METTDSIVTAMSSYAIAGLPPHDLVIARASGSYLWDKDGKWYLDLVSAYSAVNQGHCHPRIVKAMVEQCQKCMLSGYHVMNEQYAMLCKKLCELLEFDMAAAATSGAEAIDLAMRIARKWAYQEKAIPNDQAVILSASQGYYGRSMGPLSASDNDHHREDCNPFLPNTGPEIGRHRIRFGHAEDLEAAFSDHAATIAAFLVEPVQGYAGTVVPPQGYLKRVRELCSQHNVLLIIDEIQTGFGRTGYFMAYDAEDIKPDILVLGKSLTGGACPAGMVLSSRDVMGVFTPGQFGSTYSGNPVFAACAIAAIDVIIDEKLSGRCHRLAEQLNRRFANMKHPHYAGFQGRGLFFSLFVHEEGQVTADAVVKALMSKGILTAHSGDKIRFAPPLTVGEEDLWWAVQEIEYTFEAFSRSSNSGRLEA